MKYLWTIRWKDPHTGKRDKVQTSYLRDRPAALTWFLGQRPYMRLHLENVKITHWQRGDI
jgi:hypothetical protein